MGRDGETIFALASAAGRAAVAVIRVSGPAAWEAAALGGPPPPPRRLALRRLTRRGEELDEALVAVFPAGASFTGEAMAELHLHGGRATVAAALSALSALPGLRPAAPGEFTRRALENGRMDLAQVEGLADLIDAETEAQRTQAMALTRGALSRAAGAWRRDLVAAGALLEAAIDFADEDDAPEDGGAEADALIAGVREQLDRELGGVAAAARIREGFEVALVGPPNAGKSALLNALAGREAAITAATAGTTRDVVEVSMNINGLSVTFLDMAGLREAADEVEAMGVALARRRAAAADLRLFLSAPDAEAGAAGELWRDGDARVLTKSDLGLGGGGLMVSAVTGDGLVSLLELVGSRLETRATGSGLAARERQRRALARASEALELAEAGAQAEVKAEYLREATRALDALLGKVDVEDVLDEIFARFCMGK